MNVILAASRVDAPVVIPNLPFAIGILFLIFITPVLLGALFSIQAYRKAPKVDQFEQHIAPQNRQSAGALRKAVVSGALIGSIFVVLAGTSAYALGPFIVGRLTLNSIEDNYNVTIVVKDKKVPVPLFENGVENFYKNTDDGSTSYPLDVDAYPKGIYSYTKCRIYVTEGQQLGLFCPEDNQYVEYEPKP